MFCHHSSDGGEADWLQVFQILCLTLLENGTNTPTNTFLQSSGTSPTLYDFSEKMMGEQLSNNTCLFPQHSWVCPIRAHGLMGIQSAWLRSNTTLYNPSPAFLSYLHGLGLLQADHLHQDLM